MKKNKIKFDPVLVDYETGSLPVMNGFCYYSKIGNKVNVYYSITIDTRKPLISLPMPTFEKLKKGKAIELTGNKQRAKKRNNRLTKSRKKNTRKSTSRGD